MKLFTQSKQQQTKTRRVRRDEANRQRLTVEAVEDRCLLSGLGISSVAAEIPPIPGLADHSVAEVHTVVSFIDPRTLFMGKHPNHNETLVRDAEKKRRARSRR